MGSAAMASSEAIEYIKQPAMKFLKDSYSLVNKCTKPDRNEFSKIAQATSVATQCDISAERVNCTAWKPGTNDIDCKVRDERGVHSATYMLRHMARQAGNGNLMLAGAHVDRWRMTWEAEVNHSEDDPIYSLISFGIMGIIIAPFLFYKLLIDETYETTMCCRCAST